jgi:uncharacterized spore protein YtfJ
MKEGFDDIAVAAVKTQEQSKEVVEKLFEVAQPEAVFSEPVTAGEYTVITASEVSVGMGFGYGIGGGTAPEEAAEEASGEGEAPDAEEVEAEVGEASGFGGGGGGGGFSMGRPVAVISVGPGGVHVEPVRDVTKIGLALLTTAGAMLIMLGKMRKASRL